MKRRCGPSTEDRGTEDAAIPADGLSRSLNYLSSLQLVAVVAAEVMLLRHPMGDILSTNQALVTFRADS